MPADSANYGVLRGGRLKRSVAREIANLGGVRDLLSIDRPGSSLLRTFENAVHMSCDAIVICEMKPGHGGAEKILYVNPAIEPMTGYSSAELIGKTLQILYGPKTDPVALKRLHQAISLCRPTREELVHYRKDSGEFTAELSITPIVDKRGCGTEWLVVLRDTTESYLMRQRMMLAQDMAGMAIFDVNVETGQRLWSPRAFEIFGIEPDGVQPDSEMLLRMCHPDDRLKLSQQFGLLRKGVPIHTEYRIVRADGEVRWLESMGRPVFDAHGVTSRYVGVGFDVTERKQERESLRMSEERLRLAQEVSGTGTFEIDLSAGRHTWSTQMFRLFGLPEDSHTPTSDEFLRLVCPEFRDLVTEEIGRKTQGVASQFQFEITHPTGTVRWLEVAGKVLPNAQGEGIRYLGVAQDITERKQAEVELRRSEEQLRALTGRMQAAIESERRRISRELHDQLGQALTGLKMNLEWIERKYVHTSDGLQQTVSESIEMIEQTIQVLHKISSELRPQLLDAHGLKAALEWYAEQFQRRSGIVCVLAMPVQELSLSAEQEIAAFRIFQEAITNIARHAHASKVRVGLTENDEEVELRVTDDGEGFPMGRLVEDHCLGILGMRERASLIGGKFELQSIRGKGTTITLRIPKGT